ncbi:MAG TPA: surface-adhesin E family protein [Pyrinomonadaceae bacterium]|nr:surface-adhesin E family protein [Pyrinomonadaceae bacterium]
MRLMFLPFLLLFSSTSLVAQQLPEWYRVYTFDESIIEMNTSLVTFISKDVTRVRFRWTFDHPETLSGEPQSKYKSRLEVMEFNCSLQRYRPYHLTYFDSAGNLVHLEENQLGEWSTVTSGSMIQKLFAPACELIKQKTRSPVESADEIELAKAARYALSFSQHLEQAKDFKPIIEKFFMVNYLNGYLHDKNRNWFLNLDQDTAARVSQGELQRFYVALMNTGYLGSLYAISQYPSDSDEAVAVERLVPSDVLQLIRNHPYTAAYQRQESNYDFLADKIDSVERLRSYTDLLEKLGSLMRKHVIRAAAEHSKAYQAMLKYWHWTFDLYQPRVRVCARNCLGLPNGTRLFEVNVPMFRLQLAEIEGNLRVVSAMSSFQ